VDTSLPSVIGFAWFSSQSEALRYASDNPLPPPEQWFGPTVYWALLNKANVGAWFANYPWIYQTDGTITPNAQMFTRDRGFAYGKLPEGAAPSSNPLGGFGWNCANDLFTSDPEDKWSLINRRIALERLENRAFND
jgi:hypothetical protein